MSIQANHDKLNQMIQTGKAMEAFLELYADDCVMQENTEEPCVGKAANKAREEGFLGSVEAWFGAQLLGSAVAGDKSFSEWEFDLQFKGAPRMKMNQVAVRTWKDGKVVHERFYHK